MDPLITNGIDQALLGGLEKHASERELAPRRKRPAVPPKAHDEETEMDVDLETPKHTFDDLA